MQNLKFQNPKTLALKITGGVLVVLAWEHRRVEAMVAAAVLTSRAHPSGGGKMLSAALLWGRVSGLCCRRETASAVQLTSCMRRR